MALPHTPRDQLGVLGAVIDDKDLVEDGCVKGPQIIGAPITGAGAVGTAGTGIATRVIATRVGGATVDGTAVDTAAHVTRRAAGCGNRP